MQSRAIWRGFVFSPNFPGTVLELSSRTVPGLLRHSDRILSVIPTEAVFTGYGFSWGNIVDVSAKDRDGYPDANLVKVSGDSKVYVIAGGMKRHIPNADVFNDYKYKWTDILTVSAAERDAYPDATLVKTASSANVYHLASGKKEWIKTAATFNSRGYKWTDILTISSKELATYPNQYKS